MTTTTRDATRGPTNWLGGLGLTVLVAQLILTLLLLPVALAAPAEPPSLAMFGSIASSVVILALRLRGHRGTRHELRLITAFLALMPFVYLASWWRRPESGWLGLELFGAVLYPSLAIAGARRSPWILALGILMHAGWDALHHGRTSFVPDWYADGCLAVDVGLSLYVAIECWSGSWRRSSPGPSASA